MCSPKASERVGDTIYPKPNPHIMIKTNRTFSHYESNILHDLWTQPETGQMLLINPLNGDRIRAFYAAAHDITLKYQSGAIIKLTAGQFAEIGGEHGKITHTKTPFQKRFLKHK